MNITNIPAPRVPFIDDRTGLMAREWYRFFLNLFVLTGSGNNPTTLEELQIGPPSQQDFTEIIAQVANNLAPQYQDQSGDFLATLDAAQLMSMMARFENLEAAIQGAYLNPPSVPTDGVYVVNGGALGTPSSGTVTNLTGTASININGTVGATTPTTGSFTTMKASTGAAVGGATPGAGGVAFPATAVAVADVNTLDDYEEGTWTPTPTSLTVVGTPTYAGTYTKIGNMVYWRLSYLATISVASTYITTYFTGLPFTPAADSPCVLVAGASGITGIGYMWAGNRVYTPTHAATAYECSVTGFFYI